MAFNLNICVVDQLAMYIKKGERATLINIHCIKGEQHC